MATTAQREALLAVTCPWCGAAVGEVCSLRQPDRLDGAGGRRKTRPRPITVLDGGCHDARWLRAGLGSAPVIRGAVLAAQGREEEPGVEDPVIVGGGLVERPW